MANIKYRVTMTPEVRTVSEIVGAPLSNIEIDSNLKLLDVDIQDLRTDMNDAINTLTAAVADGSALGAGSVASTKLANTGVSAGTTGSATTIPVVTVNTKGQITAITTATPQTDWSNVLSKPANITTVAGLSSVANLVTLADASSIASLMSINGLTTSANKMIYTTAADTYAVSDLTSFGRTLNAAATAEDARTVLGTGNASNLSSGTVARERLPVGTVVKFDRDPVSVTQPTVTATNTSSGQYDVISKSYSATKSTNVLVVRFMVALRVYGSTSSADTGGTVSLVMSSSGGGVSKTMTLSVRNNDPVHLVFDFYTEPGSTASRTYTLSVAASGGPNMFVSTANTGTVNVGEVHITEYQA